MKKILWLITARKGSKSIPNKNIKLLGNQPLISFPIIAALNSDNNEYVCVSTDSIEYKRSAIEYGAIVPFIRPDILATDTANSIDVVLHALNFFKEKGIDFKYVGLLEPTSPFISSFHLNNALEILENEDEANSIVAVKQSRPNTFFIQNESKYLSDLAIRMKATTSLGRQSFNNQITPCGGLYISTTNCLINYKTFYTEKTIAYKIDEKDSLEIDEPIDWDFAEFLLNKRNNSK